MRKNLLKKFILKIKLKGQITQHAALIKKLNLKVCDNAVMYFQYNNLGIVM